MDMLHRGVTDRDLEQLSSLFRLLADKTRLAILRRLGQGERNVSSLCNELKLPQPTVSHHLSLLRANNLVGHRRDGKQIFYILHGGTHADHTMRFALQNVVIQVMARPM